MSLAKIERTLCAQDGNQTGNTQPGISIIGNIMPNNRKYLQMMINFEKYESLGFKIIIIRIKTNKKIQLVVLDP